MKKVKKLAIALISIGLCSTSFASQENEGVEIVKSESHCKNTTSCNINDVVNTKKKITYTYGIKAMELTATFPNETFKYDTMPINIVIVGNYFLHFYDNKGSNRGYRVTYSISVDEYSASHTQYYLVHGEDANFNHEVNVPLTFESRRLGRGKHIVYVSVTAEQYDLTKGNVIDRKDKSSSGFLIIE